MSRGERREDVGGQKMSVSLSSPVYAPAHSHPTPLSRPVWLHVNHRPQRKTQSWGAFLSFFRNQCCLIQSDFIMTRTERIIKHSFDLRLVELRVWNENLKLNELWEKNSWTRRLGSPALGMQFSSRAWTLTAVWRRQEQQISQSMLVRQQDEKKDSRAKHCSSKWRRKTTYLH